MTKTNKTLLCALLALVFTLACALTIMPVAGTKANAAEGDKYVKVTAEQEDWTGTQVQRKKEWSIFLIQTKRTMTAPI